MKPIRTDTRPAFIQASMLGRALPMSRRPRPVSGPPFRKGAYRVMAVVVPTLLLLTVARAYGQYSVVRAFRHSNAEANTPYGSLVASGTRLYGMGCYGGINGSGAIFSISADGTGYATLRSFSGGVNDGANPNGDLLPVGSVYYGVAQGGGAHGDGVVFEVNSDGTGFALLHSFGGGDDGAFPQGSLVISGTNLYGVTYSGGTNAGGTIFRISLSPTVEYSVLYDFPAGSHPKGSLAIAGTVLVGSTSAGGTAGQGTIFRINSDGSGYTDLRDFGGYPNDGATPTAPLTVIGASLFGTTAQGGVNNDGILFQIGTNGSGYTILRNSGMGAWGDGLTLQGANLYGMIETSSAYGYGAIFTLGTNGTGFEVLRPFNGPMGAPFDGLYPAGNLTILNGQLYGLTSAGGTGNVGTLFTISTNGVGYSTLHSFDPGASDGRMPQASLTLSGSNLFGTALLGGTNNLGVVFEIGTNGSGYSVLHSFSGGTSDGANPSGTLTFSGPTLFGTTRDWFGMVFSMKDDGTGYRLLQQASFAANYDVGAVTQVGSNLFGTTESGGTANAGVVYSLNTDGTGFQVLHNFQGGSADGGLPGDLTSIGSTLFGLTAAGGGTNNQGVLFKVNTDGTGYAVLHTFGAAGDGANNLGTPGAPIVLEGRLLGLCPAGGAFGDGVLFSVNTDGSNYAILHSFKGLDGWRPVGSLTRVGPVLYGVTAAGGTYGFGTIFGLGTNGMEFTVIHHFSGGTADGAGPQGSLAVAGSSLYGMTQSGGPDGAGVIFAFTLAPPSLAIDVSGTNAVLSWPAAAAGYSLQTSSTLIPPINWSAVSAPLTNLDGRWTATIGLSGAQRFFRLSQ
ncbi:MAG TPA: choice-of-anchor tandem repeat GloVer-containing protein [Verrucomicrobiae bacterium]|nr:choice-of-anchor tandem repeat GloVer-containing protein [Verrucomicrobiae bacterium]